MLQLGTDASEWFRPALDLAAPGFVSDDGEYEFWVPVRWPHLLRLVRALGGADCGDVLDLLSARFADDPEVATRGWLEAHGVPADFSSYPRATAAD